MPNINKSAPNNNLNFIQLKLFDFPDEKINHEKIISERLNKNLKIENTNQKLFWMKNNIVLRILDKNLDNQNSGFTKYNETVYVANDSMAVGNEQLIMFTYGEYIKIDGKKYWVDVTYNDAEPNYD